MSAISTTTMKRLTWTADKVEDFWYKVEKPFAIAFWAWAAGFSLFFLIKGGFFILNTEIPAVMETAAAFLFGVPMLLVIAFILLVIALLIASTPLVVAGRVMWLVRSRKSLNKHSEAGSLIWIQVGIVMFTIIGAIAGVFGLTRNMLGLNGLFIFAGIGAAVGVCLGSWAMFCSALLTRSTYSHLKTLS